METAYKYFEDDENKKLSKEVSKFFKGTNFETIFKNKENIKKQKKR